jgi:MFS transporter, DHA3 family, macrolide efflux protein
MKSTDRFANASLFATAYFLSAFGYEFLTFVLTVRVYELTGQAADVGIFMAVSFFPRLASPFYGSLTDRFPRNRLFCAACLATAAVVPFIAQQNSLAGLYAGWFVVSILAMIVMNLRTAILTQVMSEKNYHHANGAVLAFLNVTRLVAPVIGGLAATRWSPAGVLLLSAGVYVCAAGAALSIRLPDVRNRMVVFSGICSHLREGAAMVWRNVDLATLVIVAILWRVCFGYQSGLLVVYVDEALGKGSLEFGVLTAAMAVGSILGGLAGPMFSKWLPTRPVTKVGMTVYFALTGGLGLISSYPLALADVVAANFALYVVAVAVHSARDRLIPADCRGRIIGSNTLITAVPALVSMLLGGWLADMFGVRAVFVGGGLLAVVGAAIIFFLSPLARRPAAA